MPQPTKGPRLGGSPSHQKLIDMGLALKDSPPGFDPSSAVDNFSGDEDESYVETEQY